MPRDILIVDDEPYIRKSVAGILEDGGYAPRGAADGTAALEAIDSGPPPALVILDVWLEGSELDGMDVLEAVNHTHPEVPVIMISGHGTIDTAVTAIKKGAYEFIEKPLDSDRLLLTVARALEAAELRREVAELKQQAGTAKELLGTSPAIKQVRVAAERAAPTDRRVFITGPAGAGKEVVARLIHSRSRRSSGPFVVANAAMMRPDRVELELFGREEREPGTDARARSEPSSAPMAARSSSMKSPTCRWKPRERSRVSCRRTASSARAARSGSKSISASWRRPRATWQPRSSRGAFAATSTIGCW